MGLRELAHLIKGDVGVRVATIDFGGWDHHVNMGKLDGGQTQDMLGQLAEGLAAFATDLGPKLDSTTVVVMTEFGRRVEQNASWGTDHGHGATVMVMGGGVKGGTIHGNWPGIAPEALDQGDVAGRQRLPQRARRAGHVPPRRHRPVHGLPRPPGAAHRLHGLTGGTPPL